MTCKLCHLAAQIATHRLGNAVRSRDIIFFELPQTDQCFLQVVGGEVFPLRHELLERGMRRARRFQERLIELPHGLGNHLAGLGIAHLRWGSPLTGHCANDVCDGPGVDPALLENLAGQVSNPLPDCEVFVRHGG